MSTAAPPSSAPQIAAGHWIGEWSEKDLHGDVVLDVFEDGPPGEITAELATDYPCIAARRCEMAGTITAGPTSSTFTLHLAGGDVTYDSIIEGDVMVGGYRTRTPPPGCNPFPGMVQLHRVSAMGEGLAVLLFTRDADGRESWRMGSVTASLTAQKIQRAALPWAIG